MKLSTIKSTIDKLLPKLQSLPRANIGQTTARITGLIDFKNAINELSDLELFDDEIVALSNTPVMHKNSNVVEVNQSQERQFFESVNLLVKSMSYLSKSIEKVLDIQENADDNSVFVKLPNTKNLEELSKDIEVFNKIFSLTILDSKINGEVTLQNVEPGSIWLKIFVRSTMAVSFIGGLAWSSAVVYKKVQEAKLIEQIVNQKKLETEQKEAALKASKLLIDLMIEAEAENLYHTYYDSGEFDHEQLERIKVSIKMLSEEIYKGAEINPALTAPEEVSNLFPDMKALPSLESKIKRIGD